MAKGKATEEKPQKATEEKPQDAPQGDIFDEDEEGAAAPPRITQGDQEKPPPQDAPVASQDAPGDVPTQVKDRLPITGEVPQVDPARTPGEGESLANQALLDRKGDLAPQQPIFNPGGGSVNIRPEDQPQAAPGEPRPRLFKVVRGKVGAFMEGSIIPGLDAIGIKESDLPRLIQQGVIEEV